MADPLVITIEHGTTKAAAKARLEQSLGRIRAEVAPYVGSIEQDWRGDAVDFRVAALGQTVTGSIEVEERVLRITVQLPALLGFLGNKIAPRIRERGLKLLAGD
jgi:hypothetical protein